MNHDYDLSTSIKINASAEAIWQAFVDPTIFKKWMFGSIVNSNWKKGSAITYSGEWEGKPYEDKGTIIEIVPNILLKSTYFSPMSGKEDLPENYQSVTYKISPEGSGCSLAIVVENNTSKEAAEKSIENWNSILQVLKKTIEVTI